MLFSIIIPVYNVENYLNACIGSILPQLEENTNDVEILLINDGSTDRSGLICDHYKKEHPHLFRVFHNKNQGLFLSRRYGFKKAQGKYIINCDSDDSLAINTITILKKIIEKEQPDLILYNMNLWDGINTSSYFENVFTKDKVCSVDKNELLKNFFISHESISMCTKVFKKECLDLNLDYSAFKNKSFGEDTLQSAEIFTHAKEILYLNEALYNYRTSSGMTTKFNENYYQDFCFVNSYIKKYKYLWNIDDFDELYAIKLFTITGRSVTQSRYNQNMTFIDRKKYLQKIINDADFKNYKYLYKNIKSHLKVNYQIFNTLLIYKQYLIIHILLKLKNINGQ